jgi:signal transduction histidine kinase
VLPCVAVPAAEVDGEMRWSGQVIDAAGRVLDVVVARTRLSEGYRPASDVYVVHDVSHHAELSRLREQLLYDVAHELRAPLAVLDNVLEILAVDSGALTMAEFDRLVSSARRTTARLRALMEDLLSVGSIQAGRLLVTPRPTPVAGLVTEAIEAVEGLTGPRGLRIEQQVPDSDLAVLADGRYARQALVNLLANAAKFSPPDERIVVRAEPTDGQVRLSVEDRGPGIPAERQAGLFQRFYRLRPSHAEPGIGLGLAIAKGIVEAHGGAIGIDSAPGAGTRVWLTLPRAREGEA